MTNEQIFVIFVFIPYIILTIFLAIIQRKFFDRYNKTLHPKDPISLLDVKKLYDKNPSKAIKFLKNNFFDFIFVRGNLYFKKYTDNKLNTYSILIKTIIVILIILPVLIFFVMLSR